MMAKLLYMEILNNGCAPVDIVISDKHTNNCRMHYYKQQNILHYLDQTYLSYFIKQNEYQLLKLLNSKKEESYYKGFNLEFVIIPGFYFLKNKDFNNYIIVDRSLEKMKIAIHSEPLADIHEIYSDGSYFDNENNTGYAYIIRHPDGEEILVQEKIYDQGNNIAELSAVARALDKLSSIGKIRIYTDSRYVIKGIAQWIHYWKINNWKTVNNEDVKNKDVWKECEKLTRDKYLEFKWIKGHSNHFENSICDMMAKEIACCSANKEFIETQ